MPLLNASEVQELAANCLFSDAAIPTHIVEVHGIRSVFCFDPAKIQQYKDLISSLLDELPDNFKMSDDPSTGGGWSFLNVVMDKHNNHWCEHFTAEALCCLGIAIGKGKWTFPKEMWAILPGNMPYYTVLAEAQGITITPVADSKYKDAVLAGQLKTVPREGALQ